MRLRDLVTEMLFLTTTVGLVIAIFRWIDDRPVAALVAGVLFVAVPMGLMVRRRRGSPEMGLTPYLWWFGVLQFWVIFAVPIFVARIGTWGMPFHDVRIMGIPAPLWHQGANGSYLLMCLLVVVGNLWSGKASPPT